MPLLAGTRLGPYEIIAAIGTGGMGEVYRAKDTKLGREVAIKVLLDALASDSERMARFEREARVLASLDHPNIAPIFGLEDSSDVRAIVMALIDGPTLAGRVASGPIPDQEAKAIARQIIEALEYAHERGVIHRDLKPANIKITPEGAVKVLDFGLAKVLEDDQPQASSANSPTLTLGHTRAGVILGTAAYMSPEQAVGKTADRRSDIFSFGAVLYEMLSGQRAFAGDTAGETLVSVAKDDPDWSKLPAGTSAAVVKLLRRCLVKDRKQRLQAIGEARIMLEAPEEPQVLLKTPQKSSKLPWIAAGLLAVGFIAASWIAYRATRPAELKPLVRLSVDLGPDAFPGQRITAVLSPDGQRIVFTGGAARGRWQLFTRRLGQPEPVVLATGFGSAVGVPPFLPFFSPDGQWVGFFDDGKVKKVAVEGGSPITLSEVSRYFGASWREDGNIILGDSSGLQRVPEAGGVAQPVKGGSGVEIFPQVLPGEEAVLFNAIGGTTPTSWDDLDIAVLQFGTGEKKTLLHNGYWPRYLPTSGDTGHLVYVHEGTLFGVGFDPKRLEIRGTPVPLLQDIAASPDITLGGGQFDFSRDGTFVYLSGHVGNDTFPIQWLDAAGKTTTLVQQAGMYNTPRLSPDGKRLVYHAGRGKGDVWVYDLERQTPTQLTFTGPGVQELAWAADSKHVVFGDSTALWWIRVDGSGQPQRLLDRLPNPRPFSFAPDGRLVFVQSNQGLPDVVTLPMDLSDPERPKAGKVEPFLVDPKAVEVDPAFSPDGKFLAYASNESGPNDIFVRSFPGPGGKWKLSTDGGKFPVWSRAAHEILFLGSDDRIMAVSYTIQGDSFNAGTPRVWSPTPVRRMGVLQNFDVSPDGKRVVMFPRPAAEQSQGSLHATFLLNFFDEVRRKVPVSRK